MPHDSMFEQSMRSQLLAALDMLAECIRKCPPQHWCDPVGKQPFWWVAYHVLCYTDFYCSPSAKVWRPSTGKTGGPAFHPKGKADLSSRQTTREVSRELLLEYHAFCVQRVIASLAAETPKSLAGPSGFDWIPGPRYETPIYNLRHLAHHTGQLTAHLRRCSVATRYTLAGE
jgi:hypothetical protein